MGSPFFERAKHSPHRVAVMVAGVFLLVGTAWVLLTDLELYGVTQDPVVIARLETAKGWAFVGGASLLIYIVAWRSALRLSRADALTRTVVDSIADGVLILGADRSIVYANAAAARLLHCKRAGELVGLDPVEFSRRFRVSGLDGTLVPPERFISQRVFDEVGPLSRKLVLHPPKGGEVVISATAAAVRREPDGTAVMVVSVMHDITAEEHLERIRDQFFAGAAHTFKTPLAVIKANVQLLLRGAASRPERSLTAVDRQCAKIDRLLQNLLVLVRVRSNTLELHATALDLGTLVQHTAGSMAAVALPHDLRTVIAAPLLVQADPERLQIVLCNLIDNARQLAVSKAPLTVMVRRRDSAAEVGVRYQALPSEEQPPATDGDLGALRVSRTVTEAIVEAHGGSVGEDTGGAEAPPGSTCRWYWSAMPAFDDVLVVDDDPDMVEITLLVLRQAGYPCRSAENGLRALEAVAARMPSLILLDMLMPGMDGWQFASELQARYGHVPVVVVTAAEHAWVRAAEIGADGVLAKPFDIDELLRVVARHVAHDAHASW